LSTPHSKEKITTSTSGAVLGRSAIQHKGAPPLPTFVEPPVVSGAARGRAYAEEIGYMPLTKNLIREASSPGDRNSNSKIAAQEAYSGKTLGRRGQRGNHESRAGNGFMRPAKTTITDSIEGLDDSPFDQAYNRYKIISISLLLSAIVGVSVSDALCSRSWGPSYFGFRFEARSGSH